MNHKDTTHPEVKDMENVCDVTTDNSKHNKNNGVCEQIKKDKPFKAEDKKKESKELDESLEETFPASDPTAEY